MQTKHNRNDYNHWCCLHWMRCGTTANWQLVLCMTYWHKVQLIYNGHFCHVQCRQDFSRCGAAWHNCRVRWKYGVNDYFDSETEHAFLILNATYLKIQQKCINISFVNSIFHRNCKSDRIRLVYQVHVRRIWRSEHMWAPSKILKAAHSFIIRPEHSLDWVLYG